MAPATPAIGALALTTIASCAAAREQADLAKSQAFVRNSDTHKGLIHKRLERRKDRYVHRLTGRDDRHPLLQKDAMTEALAAAARPETKDCKSLDIVDTEYLRETGAPAEGSKGPPWDELWTFSACAGEVQVTVHFTPDPTGTSISASSNETKILK